MKEHDFHQQEMRDTFVTNLQNIFHLGKMAQRENNRDAALSSITVAIPPIESKQREAWAFQFKMATWEDPELTFSHRHNKSIATYEKFPLKET